MYESFKNRRNAKLFFQVVPYEMLSKFTMGPNEDLFLSNLQCAISTSIIAGTSDHSIVLGTVDTSTQITPKASRTVWLYHSANWKSMRHFFFEAL